MGFKVPSVSVSNPVIRVLQERLNFSIDDLLRSNSHLCAKVLERTKGNNEYLLNFSGKQIKLFSEAKLLIGEELKLKVEKQGHQILLEIVNRRIPSQQNSTDLEINKIWSKTNFAPMNTISKMLAVNQSEISPQKIYQFLDVFFPGIEWKENVAEFSWKFEDGEANGFLGRQKDSMGFYFHFESKKLGAVDSYLSWQKDDLSDILFHFVFDKLSTYLLANENFLELKKMLSSNSIFPKDIIFHYSTIKQEQGDWVV
ncbi:MAG: hypothetical protein KBF93_06445 [Leptospiraceae bacterium]|nr:hypothetical protein [Leptospiraceae bacterium]